MTSVPGTCKFSSCQRSAVARGMCNSHWAQWRAGKELTPLRARVSPNRGMPCKMPNCDFPIENSHRFCKKHSRYGHAFSLSDETINLLFSEVFCWICHRRPQATDRAFSVDHSHSCCGEGTACDDCVRGLLCTSCNHALGLLRDNSEVMRSAIQYVESQSLVERFEIVANNLTQN